MLKGSLPLLIFLIIGEQFVMGSLAAYKSTNQNHQSTDASMNVEMTDFKISSDGKCRKREKSPHALPESPWAQAPTKFRTADLKSASPSSTRSTVDATKLDVSRALMNALV
ncbi:hypothetical protein MJO28_009646 [Puccinia striiformis f. sp. tritici]|uniref:Uncharacterized protein n=4 Tax=Puccinia striiformis TaxID=27350 RepID=A0A0L0V5Z9_9BASI|nr:hypothetical protein Pst134EA_017491 [Puccinia striiformis f. sp. tritici]KNE94730.1 hypothetical protein PSTG_11917 [Puccinia striiformis f. sp. tritici PST-78]POW10569.1 hypothetical protein PSTT_06012 [Puccinia striiformis]KAH9450888.1 hypothetical protein Pst134EB_018397 [Puccinia striiformis f. sp. tritici]KAH9461181.1 hypothetical protein Pst134EA_017491 [Puccinia striiformis f. sp. tritici]KAI7947738.1 hypothetical protein MJO28_009646 [Puccinia striiformis f. sp. tritici]